MRAAEGESAVGAEPRGLVATLGEFARAALDLLHNAARLGACEARVIVRRLAVRLGLFVVGLVVAAVGLLLVLGGAALLLERAAGLPRWLAFVLVGLVAAVGGGVGAARALRRLGDPDLAFPGTLAELGADVEALKGACEET